MVNENGKYIYLCESGSDVLIAIKRLKPYGSYFKYEIYFKDVESCYDKFKLHNVGEIYSNSFDEAFRKLRGQLINFKYNYLEYEME